MRVLLAVDGSEFSKLATAKVREFFPGCTLDVLTIVPLALPEPVAPGWVGGTPIVTEMKLEEELAEKAIATAKAALGEGPDVAYHTIPGEPGAAIVRFAEEHKPDVIVLGSHGRKMLERILMGSVASYVVNHASQPVLVVKTKK